MMSGVDPTADRLVGLITVASSDTPSMRIHRPWLADPLGDLNPDTADLVTRVRHEPFEHVEEDIRVRRLSMTVLWHDRAS